jgi:hypothetical protein
MKMPSYAEYMKYIVNNKRKSPEAEISTMLANYSFKGKIPEKLGDLGIPTYHAILRIIMFKLLYVICELV